MPKAKHQDAMRRQWEILRMIPGRATGVSALDIIKRLEIVGIVVTKRTVLRDLEDLEKNFGLLRDDEKKPYRWRWRINAGIDLPTLTLTEAFSLKIVENILKPLVPRVMHETLSYRFKEAGEKLKAISKKKHHGCWADKVRNVSPTLLLLPPEVNNEVLDIVQTSLLKDKQVEVAYQAMGSDCAKTRLLNPLAIVQSGSVAYLVAIMDGYSDIRYYAIHRIHRAVLTDGNTIIPNDFSIDEEIKKGKFEFGTGNNIKLHAYVDDWLCQILEETPLSVDQKITHDEEYPYLTATVQDTWQLTWWLLSLGDGIEIIKPKKLKSKIKAKLQKALEPYLN